MQLQVRILVAALMPALIASQSIVLIGGGLSDNNAIVWEKVVELAGGKGKANIGLFTTASADPLDSDLYYHDMFVNVYGANSTTWIPVTETSDNGDDPAVAELVLQQTGLFFGGGDQARVIKALRPGGRDTLVLSAVKQLLREGAVVGGTSAGTACQCDGAMLTSGYSWEGLTYGAFPGGEDPNNIYNLSYEENGGLGLLTGYVIDSHFSERGREGRLIRLLQDTRNIKDIGTVRGFGVDEDVALVVTDLYTQPIGTVIAGTTGGVFFADVSDIIVTPSSNTNYRQIVTHYLTKDDSINLSTGVIEYASWKSPLLGSELNDKAPTSRDILSAQKNREWADMATGLYDSRRDDVSSHTSRETNPQFLVNFDRASGRGYYGEVPVPPNKMARIVSYENLIVEIRENV